MIDREIMDAFVTESQEHLATVEDEILALERGEADAERINRLYRALHTVKGASSFLDLAKPTRLSHALEDVVGAIRAGDLTPGGATAEALLRGVDKLKQLLDDPAAAEIQIEEEVQALRAALVVGDDEPARAPDVAAPRPPASGMVSPKPPTSEESVRISLGLLDNLMNLGSELVLVRNQALQAINSGENAQLAAIGQRLSVVTSELQASIMRTRMRRVGEVTSHFGRLVRDLARKMDKQVEIVVQGAEVELDKSIIEAIRDPLTHLVRNSIDHGIESPDERRAAGKLPRGLIVLSAFHQGGQVHVRIEDDGRGMDPADLKEAALKRGLIDAEQAKAWSSRESFNLIFTPGFSMAREVTDVSGRGVGMDVVKATFTRLGGIIEVESKRGAGTAVTVRLPLTLAIIPALIVTVEDIRFAVPQINIGEVVWLHGADVYQALKVVDDQEVYWLRDRLLPVMRLAKLLGIGKTYVEGGERLPDRRAQQADRRQEPSDEKQEWPAREGPVERRIALENSVYLLVLKVGDQQFGLLVDDVVDTEEIVVKGLHDQLEDCRAFAGTTVLGNGRIAMILDVATLLELGGLSFRKPEVTSLSSSKTSSEAVKTALLFDVGGPEWFAAPLSLITRVEEITPREIQRTNNREYFSYRGNIVPLARIEQLATGMTVAYPDNLLYVIIPQCPRPFGVLAANILDTVEIATDIDIKTISRPGVFGSAMIDGKLTLFVDFLEIIQHLEPDWLKSRGTRKQRRVLLVEDSGFYAVQISNCLRSVGIEVRHVNNGKEALAQLEREIPDVVLSDIEMPQMDGFALARQLKADPRTQGIRLYAISAMTSEELVAQAFDAGFDGFQSKLDQGELLGQLIAWCAGDEP